MTVRKKAETGENNPQLALDLANTVDWRLSARPVELWPDYAALVRWGREHGLLSARELEQWIAWAESSPGAARTALEHARTLREVIYRLFAAHLRGTAPAQADLDGFAAAWRTARRGERLIHRAEGFAWTPAQDERPTGFLGPVVRAAGELLTSPLAARVGQCQDERGCGWLFLDTSHARRRKWCNMGDCGNRAKARRHYARVKGTPDAVRRRKSG